MKKYFVWLTLLFAAYTAVNAAGNAGFIGKWQGSEKCQAVGAPVAMVKITADGPDQVFITGVYSLQGKIRGVVKGNTVTIPRQEVQDPNFRNFMIEGSLTIGKNFSVLTGVLAVLNNDTRDNCTVTYTKLP